VPEAGKAEAKAAAESGDAIATGIILKKNLSKNLSSLTVLPKLLKADAVFPFQLSLSLETVRGKSVMVSGKQMMFQKLSARA